LATPPLTSNRRQQLTGTPLSLPSRAGAAFGRPAVNESRPKTFAYHHIDHRRSRC